MLEAVERLIVAKNKVKVEPSEIFVDEEDWGIEESTPEVEESNFKNLFQQMNQKQSNPLTDSVFAPNHHFFVPWRKQVEEKTIQAPIFYSIKEKINFNEWLNKLGVIEIEQSQTGTELISSLKYMDKFSISWACTYLEACSRLLFQNNERQQVANLLIEYFAQLPNAKVKENMDAEDVNEIIALFNISLELLKLAGILWSPCDPKKSLINLTQMMDSLKKFHPNHEDAVQLVLIASLLHHFNDPKIDSEKEKILPGLTKFFEKYKTCKTLENEVGLYVLPSGFTILSETILLIHYYFCNVSPFTLQSLGTDEDDLEFDTPQDIYGETYRMKIMLEMYQKLPICTLKCLYGLSLGQYSKFFKKLMDAEKFVFECLYLLTTLKGYSPSLAPIQTCFGTRMMSEFGHLLLENGKYEFAATCYHAAIQNHKHLYNDYDYKFIETVHSVFEKNKDWKRSIELCTILLEKARLDKDIAHFTFLSEKLSSIFVERGEVRIAETYLINASQFSKQNSGKITTTQQLELNLKLSELFVNGLHLEKGIDHLNKLLELELKPQQKFLVLIKLAEAYMRKRWMNECDQTMMKIGPILDNTMIKDNLLLKLIANCARKLNRYEEAYFWITEAISRLQSSPGQSARLWYLKGKILQALTNPKNNVHFPLKFSNASISKHPIAVFLTKSSKISSDTTFESLDHSITATMEAFTKSCDFYKSIGDEVSIAKVNLRKCRVYIDLIFPQIMMTSIPNFNVKFEEWVESSLQISSKTSDLLLAMDTYMTTAEVRFVQGRIHSSKSYWNEARNVIFTLFMDETEMVMSKFAPLPILEHVFVILKRLVRLLCNFSSDDINENLAVVDAYLMLQLELDQAKKKHVGNDGISDSESDSSENEDFDGFLKSNKIYETLPQLKSTKYTFQQRKKVIKKKTKSTDASNSFNQNMLEVSETNALTQRLYERLWCSINLIPHHYQKYSAQMISEKEYYKVNKKTISRIASIMKVIRDKKIGSKNSSKNSSMSQEKRSFDKSSDSLERRRSNLDQLDRKIKQLSMEGGDLLIINAYLKSSGETERKREKTARIVDVYVPTIDFSKILARVVYILQIDTILIMYIPNLGIRIMEEFGGKSTQELISNSQNIVKIGQSVKNDKKDKWIPDDILNYLFSLLSQGRRDSNTEVQESKDMIVKIQNTLFKNFIFSYHKEEEGTKSTNTPLLTPTKPKGLLENLRNSLNRNSLTKQVAEQWQIKDLSSYVISRDPILLITSFSLSLFPWELFFDEFVTRTFSLQNELNRLKIASERYLPSYFAFFSEDEQKYIAPAETLRKTYIFDKFKSGIHLSDPSQGILCENILNVPFHTPLVKYGSQVKSYKVKYPNFNFVKLSIVSENPTQILTIVDSFVNASHVPIFVFTTGDLLDMSEAILCLLSYRPDVVLLFVPQGCMNEAMETLNDIQNFYVKNGQLKKETCAKFFTLCIRTLQKGLNIPVVVIGGLSK